MTQRTGMSSTGEVYWYDSCTNRAQKGATAYRGNSIRMQLRVDPLGQQITILKAQCDRAKAALDKAMAQGAGAATIDPEKVESLSRLMMTKLLGNSETPALKACLRATLGRVSVGNKTIRAVSGTDVLAGALMGKNDSRDNVRGFLPDWRAICLQNCEPRPQVRFSRPRLVPV